VRPLQQPQPSDVTTGRDVFETNCASCHGGAKWTKSQVFHRNNPGAFAQNGPPVDPGVDRVNNEFRALTCNDLIFKYLENVGTFDAANPLEIRDNATASIALGAAGFNVPSLLSINYHAPYLHRGQAQKLEDVFPLHILPASGKNIVDTLADQGESAAALLAFLKSLDGTTDHLRSEGDDFRDSVRFEGTCTAPTATNDEVEATEKSRATGPTPAVGRALSK
jgi:cytochrome c peroxidase